MNGLRSNIQSKEAGFLSASNNCGSNSETGSFVFASYNKATSAANHNLPAGELSVASVDAELTLIDAPAHDAADPDSPMPHSPAKPGAGSPISARKPFSPGFLGDPRGEGPVGIVCEREFFLHVLVVIDANVVDISGLVNVDFEDTREGIYGFLIHFRVVDELSHDPRKCRNNIDSMVGYEEQRLRRIEESKRKINELNLTNLAYAAMGSVKEDETERSQLKRMELRECKTNTSLRVGSKKVMASGRGNLGISTSSMVGLLKTRSQKRLSQQREDMKQ
ncbi:hypothetical protein PHJA_002496700 [Phtheirospermum japonicum]|uniref:Uncharacterized protein n=1 Tax=Phtheirospermum japonicum TaxID=374723 RepID=A0A830D122_9LAMI|nr:hypothetical protein PHJA_002496700 [Phtheirospermum japonicum]